MAGGLLNQRPTAGPVRDDSSQPAMPRDTRELGDEATRGNEEDVLADDVKPNVSADEQAQYDGFVHDGYLILYTKDGKVSPGILALLDNDPTDLINALGDIGELASEKFNPRVALAATAATVVLEIVRKRSAEGGEGKPEGDIIFHAGEAIFEDIAQIANKAGVNHYDQEDVNAAWLIAMDIYRAAATEQGLLDEGEASQDWADIVDADRQGPEALEAMLPGITSRAPADTRPGRAAGGADSQESAMADEDWA